MAIWLDLSPILASMIMGSTVATFASHHERTFNEIDGIERPFMIFLLAGASLHIDELFAVGWIGLVISNTAYPAILRVSCLPLSGFGNHRIHV